MRCMKKPNGSSRGAGTRACHDGTLAVVRGRFCRARPKIIFRASHQSSLHRIVLDVIYDSFKLERVPDPVIVGFGLPKGLPCAAQYLVSFTCGGTFEPSEQTRWQQKRMDMVWHHHPSPQVMVAKFDAASQRVYDNAGNVLPAQVHWAKSGCIQVTIHPDKRLSGSESRRRIPIPRQAAVEMPGYEEPLAFQIDVREAATSLRHIGKWLRSEESLLKQVCDGKSAVAAGTSACATSQS